MRFSDHFGLGKSQAELDFVDIPLNTDLTLFVDPYALSVERGEWFRRCNNLVVDFFQLVVDSIREGDYDKARALLAHLGEPNDTHFGLSKGPPSGRGVGSDQAGQIFARLKTSRAVQTGKLRDLSDAELMIPGISNDKISDITTNIIRGELAKYTKSQCDLLNVPTREVASGMYWDLERQRWTNTYVDLPVHTGRRILLVPKAAARYALTVDHHAYYRWFVLEFLRAEHLNAGSALVRVLKNGKQVVRIKDLEEEYPLSKDFLFDFSEDYPEILERYKDQLPDMTTPPDEEGIEEKQSEPRELELESVVARLKTIPVGRESASDFHNVIMGALDAVFYPGMFDPRKELEIHEGRKRIDIVFQNRAESGFFHALNSIHHVHCPYVFIECKNYSADPANPEFDQLVGRFSDIRGRFGILVCRSVVDKARMLQRCRDVMHDQRGFVMVLDDSDIEALLKCRIERDRKAIDRYLDQKFSELIL